MPNRRDLGELVSTMIRLPKPLYEWLRDYAHDRRMSQAEVVRQGLDLRSGLSDELWDRCRAVAQQQGRPLNAVIREALERYVADVERRGE